VEYVLGIETSCDDTSLAIVRRDGFVVECLAANQDLVHRPFGGIVPEIASRNHTLQILPLLEELFAKSKFSWSDIGGIAVTSRPGLIGSLLVGVVTAKTWSLLYNKPFVGVNHLEGHLLAAFLHDAKGANQNKLAYPYLALAVSGGHTQLYHVKGLRDYVVLGRTVDDAAGEAFDKFAKHLGLGFPGGVLVDREAQRGDRQAFDLPRTTVKGHEFDFSFSGLKSAAIRLVDSLSPQVVIERRADLCASFQEAAVDSLLSKLKLASEKLGLKQVVLTGGVSANSRLRTRATEWAESSGVKLHVPPIRYCTDNAAMIAYAGHQHFAAGVTSAHDLMPQASSLESDFREASR
jgi:N6-L-threonylcarbamoyladenine synthase